jgi:hypothetical protein
VWAADARWRTEPGEPASWPQGANLRLTALPERICSLGVLDVDLRDGVALPALRPAGGAPLSRGVPAAPLLAPSGLLHPGSLCCENQHVCRIWCFKALTVITCVFGRALTRATCSPVQLDHVPNPSSVMAKQQMGISAVQIDMAFLLVTLL